MLLMVGLTLADAVVVDAAVSRAHAVLRAVTPAVGHPSLSAAQRSALPALSCTQQLNPFIHIHILKLVLTSLNITLSFTD